jgi:large subunit ribosomal protein L11
VSAVVTVYEERLFELVTRTTAYLLRQVAGWRRAPAHRARDGVWSINEEQLGSIAETKMPNLNASSVETVMRVAAGTARGKGIPVGT